MPLRSSRTPNENRVAASLTNVPLLAANPGRQALSFHNDSSLLLKIRFGAAAATNAYHEIVPPFGTLSITGEDCLTLALNGIWDGASATGTVNVTEYI